MMITWITSFALGLLFLLAIIVNAIFMMIAQRALPNSSLSRESTRGRNWRIVFLTVTAILHYTASIIAIVGDGSGDWIEVCNIHDTASWHIWVPMLFAVLLTIRLVMYIMHTLKLSIEISAFNPVERVQLAMATFGRRTDEQQANATEAAPRRKRRASAPQVDRMV